LPQKGALITERAGKGRPSLQPPSSGRDRRPSRG
jgi:hypothetical protein